MHPRLDGVEHENAALAQPHTTRIDGWDADHTHAILNMKGLGWTSGTNRTDVEKQSEHLSGPFSGELVWLRMGNDMCKEHELAQDECMAVLLAETRSVKVLHQSHGSHLCRCIPKCFETFNRPCQLLLPPSL